MNKVELIGRICADIELKYSKNEVAMIDFSLAVSRQYCKPGEQRETDFMRCKAFAKTAEFITKWFKKGSMVAIVGRIQTGSYENADGKKIYTTDIIVEDTFFCEGKKDNQNNSSEPEGNNSSIPGFFPMDNSEDGLPF